MVERQLKDLLVALRPGQRQKRCPAVHVALQVSDGRRVSELRLYASDELAEDAYVEAAASLDNTTIVPCPFKGLDHVPDHVQEVDPNDR